MSKRPSPKQPTAKASSVADVAGAPVGTSPLTTGAPEVEVRVDLIDPSEHQARVLSGMDDEQLDELATSMRQHGQMQAICVAGPSEIDGSYSIVFGHRRWLAAKRLGWTTIRARVLKGEDDNALRNLTIIENAHRADLSPVEEFIAVTQKLDAMAQQRHGDRWSNLRAELRQQVIEFAAQDLGKSPTWVRDRAYLARCSPKVRDLVQAGRLPLTHAREIAKVVEHEHQEDIAISVAAEVDKAGTIIEPAAKLSDVQDFVGRRLFSLPQAPWLLDVEVGGKPACTTCPHNSANQPGLFEHGGAISNDPHSAKTSYGRTKVDGRHSLVTEKGVCLNHACYMAKTQAVRAVMANAAKRATDALEEVPKKDREKSLPAVAKQHRPGIVKPAAFKDRVAERIDRIANRPSSGGSDRGAPQREEIDYYVMNEARAAWYDRVEAVEQDLDKKLVAAMKARPGLFTLLTALAHARPFRALESTNPKSLATAKKSAALATLVQAAKEWKPADLFLVKLEAHCPIGVDVIGSLGINLRADSQAQADVIAAVCGFSIDTLPEREAFIDAEYKRLLAAKKAPKPATPKASKKAAQNAGKPAAGGSVKTMTDMRAAVAEATAPRSSRTTHNPHTTDSEEDLDS